MSVSITETISGASVAVGAGSAVHVANWKPTSRRTSAWVVRGIPMFAQIYKCPVCGDVWQGVEVVEFIDTDRDDVSQEMMCRCGRLVDAKVIDGRPVWHTLSEEELDDLHWRQDPLEECEDD